MPGIERTKLAQRLDHFSRDSLWGTILRSAMDDAMADCGERLAPGSFLQPVQQAFHCCSTARYRYRAREVIPLPDAFHYQRGLR